RYLVETGRRQGLESAFLGMLCGPRIIGGQPFEADPIVRPQLAQLPQFRLHQRRRAHETAQRGSVRTEYHRHVAREIDRADGVRIVMDVRWVQPSFAAVAAGPSRLGSDEPNARPIRVVVDFPGFREKGTDVVLGEKVRRTMRAVQHADFPIVGDYRPAVRWDGTGRDRRVPAAYVQNIARSHGAAAVTAEFSEREGRTAPQ